MPQEFLMHPVLCLVNMVGDTNDGAEQRRVDRRDVLRTAGAATLASLAGYTSRTQQTELEMWLGYITESASQRKYTMDLVKRAEEEFDLTINVTGVAYSNFSKEFQAASAAGDLPHLVDLQTNPEILSGVGRPIESLFKGSNTDSKVSDKILEPMKVWGQQLIGERKIMGWPLGIRPHFPIWRADWLEQAEISPDEVDYTSGSKHYRKDLSNIYEQLKQTELGNKKGYYPSATGMKHSDAEYAEMYIPQFGGSLTGVVSEDGTEATVNSKAARDAIQMQVDFIEKGYFHNNAVNQGDEEVTSLQFAGKVAENQLQDIADLWSSYREQQPQAMKNGRYVFSVPHNGGTKATLSWYVSIGFIDDAFNNQRELDTAAKFVDWWATQEQNVLGNAQKLGIIPANPEVIRNNDWFGKTDLHESIWRGAGLKTFNEFEQATVPAVPGGSAITYDIPAQMYQRILTQDWSVERATNWAAEQINSVLAEHGRR